MENDQVKENLYTEAFSDLAELVNALPDDDDRTNLRETLGEFAHDFKHTIGVVAAANAVLLRSFSKDTPRSENLDMAEFIETAVIQLDKLLDLLE